ncbi:class II aldolase/adducin family protein [Luteolibacter sp. AS25]|uniref:class II aldolase/adducin family protein n=1 Tax=Luteolibacter sp. AS25 TaxID=3135776 RepID=UPI00398ACA4B
MDLPDKLVDMNFELLHPRDQIQLTMARIYGREMTTTSGGNISVRDEDGNIWISPARVDKGSLTRRDIAKVSLDGEQLEGPHPPSSECPFHLSIYRARPDIKAIIHAHPSALVSFSICGQVPDTRVFPEAWNVCGKVAFAPYALPGSQKLGDNIAAEFAKSDDTLCVVLENHGVVVGGDALSDVFKRFETLEFTAKTIIQASNLGDFKTIDDAGMSLAEARLPDLPTAPGKAPCSRERELRKEICDFMHRAYEHGLVTSTWGSLSARIDGNSFLITPYRVDRRSLDIEDLIVVRDGCCPPGTRPSRAVHLHAAIYAAHPEMNAVINALPVSATAFSISKEVLDTRTIPESYLFLKDVPKIPFEDVLTAPEKVAQAMGPDNPVALLDHNGAFVAGKTVLDAFDRLEVLEATAEAIIQAKPLGAITPMQDEVIEELVSAFGRV